MRAAGLCIAMLALAACNGHAPGDSAGGDVGAAPEVRATTAASGASPAEATRLDALSSEGLPSGFTLALEPRTFVFPRDHGPHSDFRHEWWYVTGHLDAASGEHFGFELTFFRFALAPPTADAQDASPRAAPKNVASSGDRDGVSAQAPNRSGVPTLQSETAAPRSAWRTRQIYMAHFAITDLDRGKFLSTERYARDALSLAGAQAEPFRVWLDDWSLGTPANETGPEGSSYWQLRAADKGYTFDLQLRPVTPPVLNGNAGLSQKADAPGAASYYYSMPRLATMGRIVRDGKPLEVQGLAWLDREWGSGALGSDQQGWDWYALQFDDGATLMFYNLRKRDGQRDSHSAGTWFAPDGTTHALASDDVLIEIKDYWDSPRGGRYPARWQLRVPSLKLDVDIRPRLADQELNTSPRYWEGAANISGMRADAQVAGRAYVELVGYAK
jgi:predicted secreted hydrolase